MQKIKKAVVRIPCRNFIKGLTTADLGAPDYDLMLEQHRAYVNLLESLGIEVVVLEPLEKYPDAHFVEDTAVITPQMAVITNPGAESRKGEQQTVEPVLAKYREIKHIEAPGTVDGGDVLMVENHFFIGISDRTNKNGAFQLQKILKKKGHTCEYVNVGSGLHLKSSVNFVAAKTLILTEEFSCFDQFDGYHKIVVDSSEAYAANTLFINDNLIMPSGFHKTRQKLEKLNLPIYELEMSEARKMDGGLTCLSLRF